MTAAIETSLNAANDVFRSINDWGDHELLDACIAIRTIVLHDGVALLQAGAGIVADSDPTAEHEECLRKLAALEAAIDLAERG